MGAHRSEDHRDFRHISIAIVLMLGFAAAAVVLRDTGYRALGQAAMAACIVSFGFSLSTFSHFLRRHRADGSSD